MSRPELGTKRVCPSCAAKFYDLGRNLVDCPKCGHSNVPEPDHKASKASAKTAKSAAAAAAKDAVQPSPKAKESGKKDVPDEAVVSFEEADQETSGASSSRAASLDEEDNAASGNDADIPDADDDDDDITLLDDEDKFDEDVAAIIDADIKKEN